MLAYVLGNLLHEGHLGGLGPVQYIPSALHSKQKVGKATLTSEFWAYPENRDSVITVTPLGSRVHRPSKESGWWAQGSTPAPSALPEMQGFSDGFMDPDEAHSMMGGVPGLEAWEQESPGEVTVGTDKAINDGRTWEEHLAESCEGDLPSYNESDPPDHRDFSPPEVPSSMRGYVASPTEEVAESDTESPQRKLEVLQLRDGPGRRWCLLFLLQSLHAHLWIRGVLSGDRLRCLQVSLRSRTLARRAVKL